MKYILAVIALGLSVSANAADIEKASGCAGCHMLDKAVMGPSIKQLAEKYPTLAEMEKHMKSSMTEGSKGKWPGNKVMPKSPPAAAAKTHELAERFLELAK